MLAAWFNISGDAFIVAVAAAGAAGIAAYTAQRRLEAQLKHDRKLRAKEDARPVIDEAVALARAAGDELVAARLATTQVDRKQHLDSAKGNSVDMSRHRTKLSLHLDNEDDIATSYMNLDKAIEEAIMDLSAAPVPLANDPHAHERSTELTKRIDDCLKTFTNACLAWAQS